MKFCNCAIPKPYGCMSIKECLLISAIVAAECIHCASSWWDLSLATSKTLTRKRCIQYCTHCTSSSWELSLAVSRTLSRKRCANLLQSCYAVVPNVAAAGAIRAGACPLACHSQSAWAGDPLAPHLSPALNILNATCSGQSELCKRQHRPSSASQLNAWYTKPCPDILEANSAPTSWWQLA